ncbi:MAG: hypothetical protein ACLQU4_13110 [Limisphaerales bacterium]
MGGHLLNAERRREGRGDGRGNPDNNPGQSQQVLERTKKWLIAHGLTLNEKKTRVGDIRQEG